jgi:hypothetical protein
LGVLVARLSLHPVQNAKSMKTLMAIALVLFVSLNILFCQTLPYHPYRKVGSRYYNLQPLYDWITEIKQIQADTRGRFTIPTFPPCPMPGWYGITEGDIGATVFEVENVFDDGIMVRENRIGYSGDETYGQEFFLKNYPYQVVDGQRIRFLALRNGAHDGVPVYDYGVPYDPWKLLAESKAKTNNIQAGGNVSTNKPPVAKP